MAANKAVEHEVSGVEARDEPAATSAIQGANPFVPLTAGQVLSAAGRWTARLGRNPSVLAGKVRRWAVEEAKVVTGASKVAPEAKDRRFTDPAWQHPVWRRVAQSYLVTRETVLESVDAVGLDSKSADRARFALGQLTEAAAPTNSLLGNPAAMKRAAATRGRSLVDGGRNFVHDLRHNGGMPSQVDTRPFRVGETIVVTPGSIVHRSDLFELIQYTPTTAKVRARPTLIVPPQVNRYYFLDLAPGRSFVEHAVGRGITVLLMSWRNPGPEHRTWGMDDYAAACLEAIDVAIDITGADKVNVMGLCAGGMTEAAVLSHLAHTGNDLVASASFAVTMFDTDVTSTLNVFATERSIKASMKSSQRKGILDGESLGRVFAWMRPNDLVWNYWVANYLLGEDPPAFDVLAWNNDSTNLPAALHHDFLKLFSENALMKPGGLTVLGSPVDLSKVTVDLYVVGALTDHIVPWQSAYAATQVFGGQVRFILSNSGHIQSLVNPPGNPKANYSHADETPADPEVWRKSTDKVTGSWWEDWADWTIAHSGNLAPRRKSLGNKAHPPLEPAPGRYVLEA